MATLAEMLRQGADRLVDLPNDARRFMTNPQAFTQLVTGKNPMPRETGFAAGAMSLPPTEMSVLDPNQAPYMQGYDQGEPFGIAAMALPVAAPAAIATAKALAPKAGQMAENYMVRQGMIQPMMIGPSATLYNPQSAFEAAKMLKAGEAPQTVFAKTNTTKGLDDLFRQELSDVNSHIKGGPTFYDAVMDRMKALEKPSGDPMYAKDVFYHPKLYEAYPQLGDIEIEFVAKGNKATASYNPVNNVIKINEKLTPQEARSSMLHELQHAVQEIEGFNKGADANKIIGLSVKNYDDLMGEIGDLNAEMRKAVGTPEYDRLMDRRMTLTKKVQAIGDPLVQGSNIYKRYGGEAEARLTQLRRDLFPEKAKQFYPFEQRKGNIYGLDIDPKEAIIDTTSVLEPINRRQMLNKLLIEQK
jgi:hypothetical protein